jgi:hypothetical protein
MNILSQFNKLLENNFNKFLKNYFINSNFWNKSSDFNNYINFINDLDSFNYSFITNIIKDYFEYIDEVFFNTLYRKQFCESNGFYERTILTLFGEIKFKRRYYYDKKYNDRFYFTDFFLGLPKRKYFDPFVCAEICNESASTSYSKAGIITASKIGNRINNNLSINRASSRNIVLNFSIQNNEEYDKRRVDRLFVMLDEKFVGSQFNQGLDHMIKASVIFEDTELVYKYKKKEKSMNRYRLVNSHTCASIDNELLNDTVNYIYNNYDTDYIKEIVFMGDCAPWIKNFPKSHWFQFNNNCKVTFAMDGFHFSQALQQLTTNAYEDVYQALHEMVLFNNKKDFIIMCNDFKELEPTRIETIDNKMNYILNNWNERQIYQNNSYMRCSMESHISHIFADLFTSRPKAYSKKGLRQLLKLRLLKINRKNIKQLYLNNLKPKEEKQTYTSRFIKNKYDYELYDSSQIFNFLYRDNQIKTI